jgi:UDP-glucose 4-epimerase
VCLALSQAGFRPVVYDNLSNGHAAFVQWGELETGDIRDSARLDEVIAKHKPVAVLHFAALIEVGESVKEPGRFYENNVAGAITLIEAARRGGIEVMVFSSTCALPGRDHAAPARRRPCLVANNSRAREVLGLAPTRTLDDIVRTAWRWHAAERDRLPN